MRGTPLKTVGLQAAHRWYGLYAAVVHSNNDPLGKNRVKLQIPQVMGTALTDWAEPTGLYSAPPVPGTYVFAFFIGGEITKPAYVVQSGSASSSGTLATLTVSGLSTLNGNAVLNGSATFNGNAVFNSGVQIPAGATNGDVLTSDGSGNATWQPIPAIALPLTLSSGQATNSVFTVINTTANPTNPIAEIKANSAADNSLGIEVSGDSNNRFKIDSNGKLFWGSGSAGQDTVLYRDSANSLTTDDALTVALAFTSTGGTSSAPSLFLTDTWHSLGSLGAHYTTTLGRYRLTTDNCVELDIKVIGDGSQATTATFANTLPAAYRPATQHDSIPMGTTRPVTASDIWPRLTVDTAGNVSVINQGTASTFATCVRIPLD